MPECPDVLVPMAPRPVVCPRTGTSGSTLSLGCVALRRSWTVIDRWGVAVAEGLAEQGGSGAGSGRGGAALPLSLGRALPFFMPLAVFPLLIGASLLGGWWVALPLAFAGFAGQADALFGVETRSADLKRLGDSILVWYKLPLWLWAALWPPTLAFALWQMLMTSHLSAWEVGLLAVALAASAQGAFTVGHELIHQRAAWERRLGEVLLASVSYPHHATEHLYIHHALVGTPSDAGSAHKGQDFWSYFAAELKANLTGAWRLERERLARRHLPVWHRANPFWRYLAATGFWYALAYWMAGAWAMLAYAVLSLGVVLSMKLVNYVQHYGLRRLRLPSGRYEKVQPHHAWSASHRFGNWRLFNAPRHPDHHAEEGRRYPLLQHVGEDQAPQLPGTYAAMAWLAMRPKAWFERMDLLVDQHRARFQPQVDDWRVYDSPALAARPEAFETITEILNAAPRLAEWIHQRPELLDTLSSKEFTDLYLPEGFGQDAEFETLARQGLARLYWTLELSVEEMQERIDDIPVRGVRETIEAVRQWLNGKCFQVGVHTLRGSLTPLEAETALTHMAEAAIGSVLSAVEEDFEARAPAGGLAVIALGDLASGEATPGVHLDLLFVHQGESDDYYATLAGRFLHALRELSRESLLFAPFPPSPAAEKRTGTVRSIKAFAEHHRWSGTSGELLDLTRARCVHVAGDPEVKERFDEAKSDVLLLGTTADRLIAELREDIGGADEPGLMTTESMPGGLWDIERAARCLQLALGDHHGRVRAQPADALIEAAVERELIPKEAGQRLAETFRLYRRLRGAQRLVIGEGGDMETASPGVQSAIAQACGTDDFEALVAAIPQSAAQATADLSTLW